MNIYFTKHVHDKLEVLGRHGVTVTKAQVEAAVMSPDNVDTSRAPLLIAEKSLSPTHTLRVAHREENGVTILLTVYPVRKKSDD